MYILKNNIFCFRREVKVEKNDVVSIKAKKESDYWVIDNNNGFLVTKPHNLITGTSIVQSNFCLRRGVLQHSFRGLDAVPGVQPQDQSMTIGTLVHEVLQHVTVPSFGPQLSSNYIPVHK